MVCDRCHKEANRQITIPESPYVICRPCSGIKLTSNMIKHEYLYDRNGKRMISKARHKEMWMKNAGHVPKKFQ